MSLVQTLVMLGPEITSDFEVIKAVLSRFGTNERNLPSDAFVSELIGALARLPAEGSAVCDVGALVIALSSYVSNSSFTEFCQFTQVTFFSPQTSIGVKFSKYSICRTDLA